MHDPWYVSTAFDAIYAKAKRFWGIDINYLNGTLPLMRDHIKGVNWLTLVGKDFASLEGVRAELPGLTAEPRVAIAACRFGSVFTSGPRPDVGDQNRPDDSLLPYREVAMALKPLLLSSHPNFPGERFISQGNLVGWIRRLVDPTGW